MLQPRRRNGITRCCSSEDSEAWLQAVTEAALIGDDDAKRILGDVVAHWLEATR